MSVRLLSAGYQRSASPDAFVAHCVAAGATCLIDVRRRPYSQRMGYDRHGLAAACARVQVRYVSVPALGVPAAISARWRADPDAARAALAAHLTTHAPESLAHLARLSAQVPVCLVCVCPDADRCHRRVILDLLEETLPGCAHEDVSPR